MIKSAQPKAYLAHAVFAPDQIRNRHWTQTTRLRFSILYKVRFQLGSHATIAKVGLKTKLGNLAVNLGCIVLRVLSTVSPVSFIYTYRILHGKCARTVFTHELLTYLKSHLFAALIRSISDTKTTSA